MAKEKNEDTHDYTDFVERVKNPKLLYAHAHKHTPNKCETNQQKNNNTNKCTQWKTLWVTEKKITTTRKRKTMKKES